MASTNRNAAGVPSKRRKEALECCISSPVETLPYSVGGWYIARARDITGSIQVDSR